MPSTKGRCWDGPTKVNNEGHSEAKGDRRPVSCDLAVRQPMNFLQRYDELLDQLLAELKRTYGRRLVAYAVFGSVGRRTPRYGSDIDFLLVVRGLPRGRFNRVEEFLKVETGLEPALKAPASEGGPIALSPVFKTPEEVEAGSPLFLDLVEDARILYDPEDFLGRYLDRLRARLRELGARRIRRGNAWYWELKPDLKPGEVFSL